MMRLLLASMLMAALVTLSFSWSLVTCTKITPISESPTSEDDATHLHSLRQRLNLKLPSLFKFEQFKRTFRKHYATLVEELVRRKIYLGRAFCAFISLVRYIHFRQDHYLAVNKRSDQTPQERQRWRMNASKLGSFNLNSGDQLREVPLRPAPLTTPEIPVAEPNDIVRELEDIVRHGQEPGYRDIVEEIGELQRQEADGESVLARRRRSIYPEELIFVDRLESDKVVEASFEEDKVEEPQSERAEEPQRSLPAQVTSLILKLPGAEYLNSLVRSVVAGHEDELKQEQEDGEPVITRKRKSKPNNQLPDQVFVDLRQSGCLDKPADQGDCGACYAFAVVALYEYLYCGATGHLVAFSPQYMVSCGARGGLNNCEGAGMSAALRFVDNYGLELLEDQPYLEENSTCPFGNSHRGQIRADERQGFGYVLFENFDLYLKSRPIFFALNAPEDFDDYGGGVHSGLGCQSEDIHGMLIVGHGREDGHEYYLFRNSYGDKWGEQGYFKFRKDSIRECSSYKFGFASLAQFRSDHFERLRKRRPLKSLDINPDFPPSSGDLKEEEEEEEEGAHLDDDASNETEAEKESDAEAERKRKRRLRKSDQRRRRRQRKASATSSSITKEDEDERHLAAAQPKILS